jgi:hypothetical protein
MMEAAGTSGMALSLSCVVVIENRGQRPEARSQAMRIIVHSAECRAVAVARLTAPSSEQLAAPSSQAASRRQAERVV